MNTSKTTKDDEKRSITVKGLQGKCWNVVRLQNYFQPFGPLESVVLLDRAGEARLIFKFAQDAQEAVNNAHKSVFSSGSDQSLLFVYLSQPQTQDQSSNVRLYRQQAVWAHNDTSI